MILCFVYTVWPHARDLWGPHPYVGCPEWLRCDQPAGQRRAEIRPSIDRDTDAGQRERDDHDREVKESREFTYEP